MNRALSFLALLTGSAVLGTGFAVPAAADDDRRGAEYQVDFVPKIQLNVVVAEAMARGMGQGRITAYSAGLNPTGRVAEEALEVLDELRRASFEVIEELATRDDMAARVWASLSAYIERVKSSTAIGSQYFVNRRQPG